MRTKITKVEALFVQFLLAFLLSLHVKAVDPVEFLISKTFVENKTLVPLPHNFKYKGDPRLNDCCTLQILVTVTEYEEPGPEEGSGIEPPKATESQPEIGEISFQFYHPNIRNENVSFVVAVNEKDERTARHVLQFDNCLNLAQKTFNFSAVSTMATMKDIKMVIVNGKDDNILCTNPNATTTTLIYTNQYETTTLPTKKIVPADNSSDLKTALVASWVFFIVVFLSLAGYKYMKYRRNKAGGKSNIEMETGYAFSQEEQGAVGQSEFVRRYDTTKNNEIKGGHEESEELNEKAPVSDIERSEPEDETISRNITRGGRPGASNPLLTEKQGDPANSQWITKICNNKPFFFAAVFACVWFIGCVIATGIIVPSLLSEN